MECILITLLLLIKLVIQKYLFTGKRKASSTDVAEKLIESCRLIEERKERRHMEKIELQTKLLEKLDKFIEKM